MGFAFTESTEQLDSENRVVSEKTHYGIFFDRNTNPLREINSQPLISTKENSAYDYKTVSGRTIWLNRDPIGEQGGLNIYGFVNNDGINYWDVLGRSPLFLTPTVAIIRAALSSDHLSFFNHWFTGGGSSKSVSFNNYDPGWEADHFSEYTTAKDAVCTDKSDQSVTGSDTYDTNGGPGRVNVDLSGDITYDSSDCSWSFSGTITIQDNTYNFNSRPYGDRDEDGSIFYIKENLTRAAGILPGTDYEIIFNGSRSVSDSGTCT